MAFIENRTKTSILIPGPQDLSRTMRKWWIRRRKRNEVRVLLQQDDWVLNDMGITKGDIREALAFRGDTSLHLRALAARRRFWAKSSSRI